ncbi:non-canonical purine NTP pyrophosphatase, partial [Paracoccus sp. APAP_BH8]
MGLADDSGITVDGLDGAPGVYTADWAETPRGAEVSSGRSLSATSPATQEDWPGSAASAASVTGALPPIPAASKLAVRMVKTFFASRDFTRPPEIGLKPAIRAELVALLRGVE